MSNQNTIQEELRSLNSGLPVNYQPTFSVPDGYFEGLAGSILAKIRESELSVTNELQELSPLLAGIPKKMPYSVPFSYFEENIEAVSSAAEEKESLLLQSIGKQLPFSVPQGYFENLSEHLLAKVAEPETRVVPLFARTWMRMAAAAVVTGALVIAGFQYFAGQQDKPVIANQPSDSTQTQIARNEPLIEKEIKKISTEELEKFIETVQVSPVKVSRQETSVSDKKEVEALLKDVSINEMESFLSSIPTADEELLVTD